MNGVFFKFNKKQLEKLENYDDGYEYVSSDFSGTIFFLKLKDSEKDEYIIPSIENKMIGHLSNAIVAFLDEKEKIIIKSGDKEYEFIRNKDTIEEIYGKFAIIIANT
ncbi:MAG: hypothetical protein HFJ59_01480 [Clostridia bacterium]|nr:hypothetical protein [Clostridia bacterium]